MPLIPDYTIEDLGLKDIGFFGGSNPYFSNEPLDKNVPASSVGAQGITRLRSSESLGRVIYINPGDNIQNAIETLRAEGNGGTIFLRAGTHLVEYEITGISQVNIVGAGRDSTILEFNGSATGLSYAGTNGNELANFLLRDFTLQNSNNAAGINIDFADFWTMENVRITSCDQDGLNVDHSRDFRIFNTRADANAGEGFQFTGNATRSSLRFFLFNCLADSNTGNGFAFVSTSATHMQFFNLANCTADSNTTDGFDFTNNSANLNASFFNCIATGNTIGFDIASGDCVFIGCFSTGNSGDGFQAGIDGISLIGCFTDDLFDMAASETLLLGCNYNFTTSTDPKDHINLAGVNRVSSFNNIASSTRTEKRIMRMQNTSGATINAGNVVVLKAVTSGDQITTTTTQGDDLVFGMVIAQTANNEWADVLVEGYTIQLTVDGTTDIAVGDLLGTFTTAGIAMKAATGDMAFAMSLENFTTDDSSGVIDA